MKIVLNILSKCVTIVYTIFCKANPPTYLSLHLGCEGVLENSLALGVVHLALALVTFNVKSIDPPLCNAWSNWALASPHSPSHTVGGGEVKVEQAFFGRFDHHQISR